MRRLIEGTELIPLFHNALAIETDENGALRFRRFTEKQVAVYEAQSNVGSNGNYAPITQANTGVALDFVTDSSFVGCEFTWKDVVGYPYACFDFFVDGVHYDSRYIENPRYNLLAFDIPEGTHRVQIFFPWNSDIRVKSVAVDGTAAVTPAPKKKMRILSYGDSITQGYVGIHPAYSYTNILARHFDAELLNQAIGGYYFDELSLDPALVSWKPDLITLAYGTNDYYHKLTLSAYRDGVEKYCAKLNAMFPETKILGIMPIYRNDERFVARTKIWEYRYEEGLESIRETYAKYPNIVKLEDTFYPHHPDYFFTDFLHPNDAGFQIYGEAVCRAVENM